MRKALIVGIDYYSHLTPLTGCVNDASAVEKRLSRHADNSINFVQPKLMLGTKGNAVDRASLRDAIEELFNDDIEVALLYFAGHGFVDKTGGYLCTSDSKDGHDGVALSDVTTFIHKSDARNKILLLDSCHSGAAGEHVLNEDLTELSDGVTILTALTKYQYAEEAEGSGLFTALLVEALDGAAADVMGQITPGSIYAHVDRSLGSWSQRPVFKTNIRNFVSLRQVKPPVPTADLRRIAEFFPQPAFEYPLDPSYEPTEATADPQKTAIFEILQKYNRVNLLVPVNAKHMWNAAVESKAAKLTASGEHYRRLVQQGLI